MDISTEFSKSLSPKIAYNDTATFELKLLTVVQCDQLVELVPRFTRPIA